MYIIVRANFTTQRFIYSLENEPISASTSYKNIENVNNEEIASDIQDFILSKRPENTVKKTRYDMNAWGRYFESENEQRIDFQFDQFHRRKFGKQSRTDIFVFDSFDLL